jgi:AcrR family transcriptional regulator
MAQVRNAAATRERLLACAWKRFLREGYEGAGLRDIAKDAGVNVALVGRYFGSKGELFKQVLGKDAGDWKEQAVQADDLPSFLAEIAMKNDRPEQATHVERLLIMLRSTSSPEASELVRQAIGEDVLTPLSKLLCGEHATVRAAMALSVLMGMTVFRTVLNVSALAAETADMPSDRLTELLRVALSE